MRTCGQCKYLDDSNLCKGHPPVIIPTGQTVWAQVSATDKACFKFGFETGDEDSREDTEILYEYIRMGKRRTMKQIENYVESWDFNRITNTLDALKASKLITSKQQGVAYYYVCIDENKKYTTEKFKMSSFLLSVIPQENPIHFKELTHQVKQATHKGLDSEYFNAMKQLIADKFVKVIATDEGQYYLRLIPIGQ